MPPPPIHPPRAAFYLAFTRELPEALRGQECLAFSSQEKRLQAYLAAFEPRPADKVAPHMHEGAEFVHVLEGVAGITYLDEEMELNAGDSVYFDSAQPHGFRSAGETTARALAVTTPPRMRQSGPGRGRTKTPQNVLLRMGGGLRYSEKVAVTAMKPSVWAGGRAVKCNGL